MEETVKEQQPVVVPGKSKLRYPLRSATKAKEEKQPVAELSNSSASKRVRPASSVSKSVGILDLSSKEKSAKPPRRLSIPTKSGVTTAAKSTGNITPISETRTKRTTNVQGRSETPLSDVSRTSNRKKFNMLASSSYWLSQIKLSESAAKHSISIGFFKLALEAGCEPLQRMRDELKSYVRRHELGEMEESLKELFERYNIGENQEQVQVSESCSQVPEEGTRSSDDEVHSSSSTIGTRKLRPRSLNADAAQVPTVTEPAKKEITKKNTTAASRARGSLNKNRVNSRSVSDSAGGKLQKKQQKPSKQETTKEKNKINKQGKKSASEEAGSTSPSSASTSPEENKENVNQPAMEEINLTEVIS
ncbi:uncharacterized protein LOC105640505 isoform X2 [Jatropha curcas]|uniref:uncharacterized protein LOC105640505 isoform X2 n=1 Tax=Jatropha curcas TaxID=180498 RepID=UPI0005FB34D1|nr:uncharacterized protein LOC105640505 isoform X2 [Jatropha curcas]